MNDHKKFAPLDAPWTPAGAPVTRRWGGIWEQLVVGFLSRTIRDGTLTLVLPAGNQRSFGAGTPFVTVEITSRAVLRRIALDPDLAVGEAYMDGGLKLLSGDIYDFLELCLRNLRGAPPSPLRDSWARLRRFLRPLALYNPARVSRRNVAHHYDLSDELYDLFLDAERQYSCAYFRTPDDTLECAQAQKMSHITAKLLLEPGKKVLDIGSGWGGLAISLAADTGAQVTGLTLSTEQLGYATARSQAAGLDGQVQFHLRDYRQETGQYDRIVSVGMFEHVGPGHYDAYFRAVSERLTEDGVALIHTIGTSSGPGAPHPWIRKYIFPGGYIPALSEIMPAIERNGLVVTDIEVLRLHYAETLRGWRQRFNTARARVAELYDERFCRMWEFYLASCEAGFRHNDLVVFQIQLAKRNDVLPLTRDYISMAETV